MIKMRTLITAALIVAASVFALSSCKKSDKDPEEKKEKVSVVGSWELARIETKSPKIGDQEVSIYITFTDKAFTLYQKIGLGRYTKFVGSYTFDGSSLSGSYTGGKAWGPYEATLEGESLTLAFPEGQERDIYTKIDAIPESVTSNVY